MWVLSLCIYWCNCWCCFLLNIFCLYIDPWRGQTETLNAYQSLFKWCQSNTNSRSTKIALCWCSCIWCWKSLYGIPGYPCGYFLRNFVSKSLEQLCKTKQFTKQRLNIKQRVEKEFVKHIIEICCNSRMLVKSNRYWLLNWQSKGGNLLSDS